MCQLLGTNIGVAAISGNFGNATLTGSNKASNPPANPGLSRAEFMEQYPPASDFSPDSL